MMPDLTHQFFGINPDPKTFIWLMHWWPYAIKHSINPLFTTFLWAPDGYNITEIASIPFISLIMLPIAKLYGYIAAFNLITIFASALSAYTAYLLCKNLTRSFWPALFGGYFFGFSSYQIAQMIGGHINLSFTMMLPLIILLIINWITTKIKSLTFVILISICTIIQFLISKEIFITFNFFLLIMLLITFFVYSSQKNKIINLAWLLITSYIITMIVASPFIYYFLFHSMAFTIKSQIRYATNLLHFFIPTNATWIGGNFFWKFTSKFSDIQECGAYLGLPLIIIIILYIKEFWQTKTGKLLTISILITAFCSLGAILKIGPYFTFTLPWILITKLPIFSHVLSIRFILFSWLSIAMLIALWLQYAKSKKIIKYSLVICSIIFILPNPKPHNIQLVQKINFPPFIKNKFYQKIMQPHDIMLVLPISVLADVNNTMLWQVETSMYFKLATGATGGIPYKFYSPDTTLLMKPFMCMLITGKTQPKLLKQFKFFVKKQHIAIIAIKKTEFTQFKHVLTALKIKPITSEKYLFYQTKLIK
ncbi:MAG: hypothetical protein PVI75_06770 [Gammaproteobacteria bacterium]